MTRNGWRGLGIGLLVSGAAWALLVCGGLTWAQDVASEAVAAPAAPLDLGGAGIALALNSALTWGVSRFLDSRLKTSRSKHTASIGISLLTAFVSAWAIPGVGAKEAALSALGWFGSQGVHSTARIYAPRAAGSPMVSR